MGVPPELGTPPVSMGVPPELGTPPVLGVPPVLRVPPVLGTPPVLTVVPGPEEPPEFAGVLEAVVSFPVAPPAPGAVVPLPEEPHAGNRIPKLMAHKDDVMMRPTRNCVTSSRCMCSSMRSSP
jgi:hypothetical protein